MSRLPAASEQMLFRTCDSFEMLPVAVTLQQMPVAHDAGDRAYVLRLSPSGAALAVLV